MTQVATVSLTWTLPHQQCIVVDVGTSVEWTGNFALHPLTGGVTDTPDPASPISMGVPMGAGGAGTNMTTAVPLPAAGDFPYYCVSHFGAMQGVIYVE